MKEDVETLKSDWLTDNVRRCFIEMVELGAEHTISEYQFLGRVRAATLAYATSHPASVRVFYFGV